MDNLLFLSEREYDIHTIRKVAAINYQLGVIGVHDIEGGYLLSFSDYPDNDPGRAKLEFKRYLEDFTRNIWSH